MKVTCYTEHGYKKEGSMSDICGAFVQSININGSAKDGFTKMEITFCKTIGINHEGFMDKRDLPLVTKMVIAV